MELEQYQSEALRAEQAPGEPGLMIALLGLAGETGSLLTEYKKRLRDGAAHEQFTATMAEELGDVLWYTAAVASHLNLDLAEVAAMNLAKIQSRWPDSTGPQLGLGFGPILLDESFPHQEQIPREFTLRIVQVTEKGKPRIRVYNGPDPVGDPLTDNAYDEDGYRFHDAFHLAYAAVLGWSPVMRRIFKCKRKSNHMIDEVEDGARAQVIEEAVAAFIYDYARRHGNLEGITTLDYQLLKTIKSLTSQLEVSRRSYQDWEQAILMGYEVWRGLVRHRGGLIIGDLHRRTIRMEVV